MRYCYDEYNLKERIAHKEEIRKLLESCNSDINKLSLADLERYVSILEIQLMFCDIWLIDSTRSKINSIKHLINIKMNPNGA